MSRPLKPIDGEQVRKLAFLGCSYREIAAKFGCDEKTIRNRFSAEKELGEGCGNVAIRRWQMKRARAGSDTMLTVLGKARLGQSDKLDLTSKGEQVGATVVQLPIKELHADHQTESGSTDPSISEPV